MMSALSPPAVAALMGAGGLAAGSFANVVVYRVPKGRSVVRPPSACPKCGERVRPYDNMPVVSYVALRGRCRDCRAPISARYPAVEALVAALFAGVGWRFGASWTALVEAALVLGLVVLGLIDLDHMVLPGRTVYAALLAVVALSVAGSAASGDWGRLGTAAATAAAWWVVFFTINYVAPHALGFGDVRLALLLGFGLGWLGPAYAFLGFIAASALGSVVGLGLVAAGKAGRRTAVPFGTFLAAGALLAVLAGGPVVHWYLGLVGAF